MVNNFSMHRSISVSQSNRFTHSAAPLLAFSFARARRGFIKTIEESLFYQSPTIATSCGVAGSEWTRVIACLLYLS